MERRLDDLLSRIAVETQEIRDLEQQLTDGQILANEALQSELKDVIRGLQEYLRDLREQAGRSQQQVHLLEAENQSLQRLLEDTAPTHTQVELSALWSEAQSLRDGQVKLEAELLQLRAELPQQEENPSLQRLQARFDRTRTQVNQFTEVLLGLQEDQREPEELEEDKNCSEDLVHRTRTSKRALQQNHRSRLQDRLHGSESRTGPAQQNLDEQLESTRQQLQDLQQEKDSLQQQLRSLSSKLRQLRRSASDADRLTAEQLRSTTEQLKVLNDTMELLDPQRRLDEPQLRAELDRTQSQTHKLRQKLDRIRTRIRPDGLSAPSLVSQGTQDSGLELQYLSSPDRGRQLGGPQECVCSQPAESSDCSFRGGPPGPAADPQNPLTGPTWMLCGPPAGGAAPLCNVHKHRVQQGGRCVSRCVLSEQLEEEKKKLRMETKQLHLKLRRVRCVTQVCEEVECLEKTLLKRRAELRQADRLLLEAESCRRSARGQVDVLQLRLQDGATCLLEETQHLRKLQEEVELMRRRRDEEEVALRSGRQEYQQLSTKIQTAVDRLAGLLWDCQEAQRSLDSLTCQVTSVSGPMAPPSVEPTELRALHTQEVLTNSDLFKLPHKSLSQSSASRCSRCVTSLLSLLTDNEEPRRCSSCCPPAAGDAAERNHL
ncbi:centriolin [Austrofundulus limnaeus]|uniref:Centriolin n=1 Tax=Austrofundulus limnaeus TaxID=52670 RepID=A0A2I4CE52_AUSLI|nr:PREDICTED: centriolin-like [Austrofundulus limnaeus]